MLNFRFSDDRFVWDEAKYPIMSPLKEIVDGIHGQVAKIEDDLKVFFLPFCSYKYLLESKYSPSQHIIFIYSWWSLWCYVILLQSKVVMFQLLCLPFC